MPTNPNEAFANRAQFDQSDNLMMTPGQERNIHHRMNKRDIHWASLTLHAIGEAKLIDDLTFYEAAKCIEKLKSWERI